MATITLKLDTREAEAKLAQLGARAPRVIMRSLNRSASSGRTAISRVISKDMGIKVSEVRDRINILNATLTALRVVIYASAKRIPLIQFKASGPEPSRGRGRSVRAGGKSYPGAFIATMGSGHRGVFIRSGASRRSAGAWSLNLPIAELTRASIAHVFKKHEQVALDRVLEQLGKNLGHELAFEMSQTV